MHQIETGNTSQLAEIFRVKEQTVRHSLSTKGHYAGLRPTKAPNRLLYWNLAEARKIVGGATATQSEVESV